jgi:succinyl-CoA synthetase beta subunit
MARLHEYQGKKILAGAGVKIPDAVVLTPENREELRKFKKYPAVLKGQAWTTSRFKQGLILFVDNAEEAEEKADELFGRVVNNFAIDTLLLEEKLAIEKEYFFSYMIDDAEGKPRFIFSSVGGSGIEEILKEHPEKMQNALIDSKEFYVHEIRDVIRKTGIHGRELLKLSDLVYRAVKAAVKYETRSLEINPIVRTEEGEYLAADCRVTVDDYAVFRHNDLGIEIARELSNPPTRLDRIAYQVEKTDYRGTFYFIQMETGFSLKDNYVGFHGAGGGGSMMSMDAIQQEGFKIANFCDTSGNPPASKVYRAAKIIASQPNIRGYFGSGSGVASQEQVHSARGLVKAFKEIKMNLPVVIRLGGNLEDEAVEILENYTGKLPAPVKGYKKDDPVSHCAKEFKKLTDSHKAEGELDFFNSKPGWIAGENVYSFKTVTGEVFFNHDICSRCGNQVCVEKCIPQILKLEAGKPVLAIDPADAEKGKCIECLICEVECQAQGMGGGFVHLPIDGFEEYVAEVRK